MPLHGSRGLEGTWLSDTCCLNGVNAREPVMSNPCWLFSGDGTSGTLLGQWRGRPVTQGWSSPHAIEQGVEADKAKHTGALQLNPRVGRTCRREQGRKR
jgi:hypothetical protein